MQIDLEGMPFVDGHMHAPLAQRPATPDEYAWPWYEGNRTYLEMAQELVPVRWGVRQMGARVVQVNHPRIPLPGGLDFQQNFDRSALRFDFAGRTFFGDRAAMKLPGRALPVPAIAIAVP